MEAGEVLLRSLIDRDRYSPDLDASAGIEHPWPMSREEVDGVLRDAVQQGHLIGHRFEGDGSMSLWQGLELTVAGLRALGEWPPPGGEYRQGPWDGRRWGRVARPLLAELFAHPPDQGIVSKPFDEDSEQWRRWTDLRRLRECGLVDGNEVDGSVQDIWVTRQGRIALDPSVENPLVNARGELDRGAKAEAVTLAVDGALKPVLHRLADRHSVDRIKRNGENEDLNVVNDRLKAAQAYDKSHYGEIYGWLQIRNVVDHGDGQTVRDRRIERVIVGVEGFIEEMDSS